MFMKNHGFKRCLLSKSNSFDRNFMKLGHIVKYYDVFFKFSSFGPLFMKIHHLKRCPLSKSNIFYQNFMKLGHIV